MTPFRAARRIFSLEEARAVLPEVKHVTAEAVRQADALVAELRHVDVSSPDRDRLAQRLHAVVERWIERIEALHLEAKGLWLVDFDNGHGYYCWAYPEETIGHFHGYEDGFAGRMKIV